MRDVEAMGVAGGWFVLGLGWVVERERAPLSVPKLSSVGDVGDCGSEEEELVVIGLKGRGKARVRKDEPSAEMDGSSSVTPTSGTCQTEESMMIRTPGEYSRAADMVKESSSQVEKEYEQLKLLVSSCLDYLAVQLSRSFQYDLLEPLLHLYRHGHIQSHDPVALPSIIPAQLPSILQPQGDCGKGRNVWHLGGVVASALLELRLTREQSEEEQLESSGKKEARKRDQRRLGIAIMANYIVRTVT